MLAGQVALQPEATGTGLVDELQSALGGEFLDQPIDGILLRADGADVDDRIGGRRTDAGDGDGILVDIQPDKDSAIFGHADLR